MLRPQPDGALPDFQAAPSELVEAAAAARRGGNVADAAQRAWDSLNPETRADFERWLLTSTHPIASENVTISEKYRTLARIYAGEIAANPRGTTPAQGGRDYIITDADALGQGGAKTKFEHNYEAIKLLKQIEAEGRMATPSEQAQLVKYVGWGGIWQPLDDSRYHREWIHEARQIKELLTRNEFESAQRSTPNAHYTSPTIIRAMWKALQRMGFDGGRVLEPAGGVGHFFGLMPPELAARSKRTLVELDSITARIARQLYQDAHVIQGGYETTTFPSGFFDLAISNVPFGNYAVSDPAFVGNRAFLRQSIHNYFFAKALEHVRPGGMVAFITSRYTMDGVQAQRVREYLAQQADLVTAIRLPNTTFEENAMTNVTTDILFLRKRLPGEQPSDVAWTKLTNYVDEDGNAFPINEYYAQRPEMMLGKMKLLKSGTTAWSQEGQPNLVLDGDDIATLLDEAVNRLPEGVYLSIERAQAEESRVMSALREYAKQQRRKQEGTHTLVGGKLHRIVNGAPVLVEEADPRKVAVLTRAAMLDDALDATFRAQMEGDEAQIAAAQKALNSAYDEFVAKHGAIHSRANMRALEDDPALPRLLALERFDPETGETVKADIFAKRVIGGKPKIEVTSARDALTASLFERGKVDLGYMSQLLSIGRNEVVEQLKGAIYKDPSGDWVTADEYLSGNVREKLAQARAALQAGDATMADNVAAIEAVIPPDIPAADISVQLGSPWVPVDVIQDFIHHISGKRVEVKYNAYNSEWTVDDNVSSWQAARWATARVNAFELIRDALNLHNTTVYDPPANKGERPVFNADETKLAREAQQKLREEFERWIWQDATRVERLQRTYNDTFNAIVPRRYDSVSTDYAYPGINPDIELRPHQRSAVARILANRNTYLAHGVGAGKTFTMVTAAMEMRRMGLRRKPMFAVLKSTLPQWEAEFRRLYPAANILVMTKDDLTPANRKAFMSRIATNDYDAVIVTHGALAKLPLSPDTQARIYQEQLDELVGFLEDGESTMSRRTLKQLEKRKADLEAKISQILNDPRKDDTIPFEALGVDQLFVDEAHLFKNLTYRTRLENVRGLGSPEGSMRAFDLYAKARVINERNGGVVFASATPVTNTLAEVFLVQKYLQPHMLKRLGLESFDAWVGQFARVVTRQEETATGWKDINRLSKFTNLPELKYLISEVMDIKRSEDLGLNLPKIAGGEPQAIVSENNDVLRQIIASLKTRAKDIEGRPPEPGGDNILVINTDAKKAALDLRVYDPSLPDLPGSKINNAVNNVKRIYDETADYKGTQMIFIDLSAPGAEGFSAYDEIVRKLVDSGVPRDEIAVIHDYDTDAKKARLNDLVNAGQVRIALGSTDKLGTGTNMQRLLVAAHHLDVPYKPSQLEQRNGRIVRQGNLHAVWDKPVQIYNYVQRGSLDSVMWRLISTKAGFISEFMSDILRRTMDEEAPIVLNAEQMAAAASDDPTIFEQMELAEKIESWDRLRTAIDRERRSAQIEITRHRADAAKYEADLAKWQEWRAKADANATPDLLIEWGGRVYDRAVNEKVRAELADVLKKFVNEPPFASVGMPVEIGRYRGFRLVYEGNIRQTKVKTGTNETATIIEPVIAIFDDQVRLPKEFALSPVAGTGNVARIENAFDFAKDVAVVESAIQRARQALSEAEARSQRQFEYQQDYEKATARLKELRAKAGKDMTDDAAFADAAFADVAPDTTEMIVEEPRATYQVARDMDRARRAPILREVDPETVARYQDHEVEINPAGEGLDYKSVLDVVRDEQLRALNALREEAKAHLTNPQNAGGERPLTPAQRKVLEQEMKLAIRQLNETTDRAKSYAKAMTKFTLLDYDDKRKGDLWLSSVVPFSYWATRQGRNFIYRLLNDPQMLIAYWRYRQAVDKENRRRQLRGRFDDSIGIPLEKMTGGALWDVYIDPTQFLFPFDPFMGRNYRDAGEQRTALQELYELANAIGLQPSPVIDVPLRMSGLMMSKQPGQAGYEAESAAYGPMSIGTMTPQARFVQGVTATGVGGPMGVNVEGLIRGALGGRVSDPYDAYIVARSIADAAAEANAQQGQIDVRPYLAAQEWVRKHADNLPAALAAQPDAVARELQIAPALAVQALAIANENARRATQQRGFQQLGSILGGQLVRQLPPGEKLRGEMRRLEKAAAYNPVTGVGSREEVKAVQQAFPALKVQRAQYGALPGDERDYAYLLDMANAEVVNRQFDALKDMVIHARPWDRRATRAIEAGRRAALASVDRRKKNDPDAASAWMSEYQRVIAEVLGGDVATAEQMEYRPRSVAGATPSEATQIRREEVMRFLSERYPEATAFTREDGTIDYDAYRAAVAEFGRALPLVAVADKRVQGVLAQADKEGRGTALRKWIAELSRSDIEEYWRRNDSPAEAAQRAYFDLVYKPVMDAYRRLRDEGDPQAWDKSVAVIGELDGRQLAGLVRELYGDKRFTEEQLAELAQMRMPAMQDVMRANMSDEARRKDEARSAFWEYMRMMTPPGKMGYKLRQIPLIAAALDQSTRATLSADQYRLALAMAQGWMGENFGEVTPEIAQEFIRAREERKQFELALAATVGQEGVMALAQYEAMTNGRDKERYRRRNPLVNRALRIRATFERQHPVYAKYYGRAERVRLGGRR